MDVTFDQFKDILSEIFGQPLNPESEGVARDFWANMEPIAQGVVSGTIRVRVDLLALARVMPQYKSYQTWKGLGCMAFLVGAAAFLFSWKLGMAMLVGSAVASAMADRQRRISGREFVSGIQGEIKAGRTARGAGRLCAHYIAGHVQLATGNKGVHWPENPSDVLAGRVGVGLATSLPPRTVKAHVLDPNKGCYSDTWTLGEQISHEQARGSVTGAGDIYVAVAYEEGHPQVMLLEKGAWQRQKAIFDQIGERTAKKLDDVRRHMAGGRDEHA